MNPRKANQPLLQQSGEGGGGGGDWRASFGAEGATALKDYADPGAFLKAHQDQGTELATLKSAQPGPWFSDEHKDYVANKGYKDPNAALTSLRNLETLFGADKAGRTVVLPKDANDKEGTAQFRAKLGVPEKAEGYELPIPQGDNGAFAKTAAAWFHELGIPKAAGQAMAAKWNEHLATTLKTHQDELTAESNKQLDGLKAEWGDDFAKNEEQARRFMKAAGFTDDEVGVYEQAFGTANMLKRWASIGAKLGEAGFVQGEGGGTPTATKAREDLEALRKGRIEGTVTDTEWNEKSPKLMELANSK